MTEILAKPVVVTVPIAPVASTPFKVSKVLPTADVPATPVTDILAAPLIVTDPIADVPATPV